jgi:predicted SprT family Zn-dependent metalloprotease
MSAVSIVCPCGASHTFQGSSNPGTYTTKCACGRNVNFIVQRPTKVMYQCDYCTQKLVSPTAKATHMREKH